MNRHLVRDYENPSLSLDARISSLARRFPCLNGATGVDHWAPDPFYQWISAKGEGTPAWHAGLLILGLWGKGAWPGFDVIAAIRTWDDSDRAIFSAWSRCWKE